MSMQDRVFIDFDFGSQTIGSAVTKKLSLLKTDKANEGHSWRPVSIELHTHSAYTVQAAANGFDFELHEVTATGSNKLLDLSVYSTAGDITTNFVEGTRKVISIASFETGADRILADAAEIEARYVSAAGASNDIGLMGRLWLRKVKAGV